MALTPRTTSTSTAPLPGTYSVSSYEYGIHTFGRTVVTLTQLPLINAAAAYDRGATGKDVTITIVDSGINVLHREFAKDGKADPAKVNVRHLDAFGPYLPTGSNQLHGTAVASVAAGKKTTGKAQAGDTCTALPTMPTSTS